MQKVSVIIPCYNDGKYIKECIDSVLNQSYPSIEIIVVDDGSTDEFTKEILKKNTWQKTQILYTQNNGPAAARNIGITQAQGTYILPLDADDYIDSTYIEKAVQAIEETPNRGIVYCKARYFGMQKGSWELAEYDLHTMLIDNLIFVTALFRKSDWESVGGFDENLTKGMEDYEFWLALIEQGCEVYRIPEELFFYRQKSGSRSRVFQKNRELITETYNYIYEKHKKLYMLHADAYMQAMRKVWVGDLVFKCKIKKSLGYLNHITEIPVIKKQLKKMMHR